MFLYIVVFMAVSLFAFILYLYPVKTTCECTASLDGKVALVTGGNSGIGLETAKDFARRGARVIIASSNEAKSYDAVMHIVKSTGNNKVEYKHLDLCEVASVNKFAKDINENYDRLDILVNNAGLTGLKHEFTEHGIDKIMQINYFGPFLLTNLLLNKLIFSSPSRIVLVSSIAHFYNKLNVTDLVGKTPMNFWRRYGNSKLCIILWAKALAKRLPDGVTVNVLDPGLVATDIVRWMPKIAQALSRLLFSSLLRTPKEGAQTTIHVSVSPELNNVSGKYFTDGKISKRVHKITYNDDIVEQSWDKTLGIIKNM